MALENTGERPETHFEIFIDTAEAFFNKIDTAKALRGLRIFLKIFMLVFPRVVPMKPDERELYDNLTGAAKDGLNAFENP